MALALALESAYTVLQGWKGCCREDDPTRGFAHWCLSPFLCLGENGFGAPVRWYEMGFFPMDFPRIPPESLAFLARRFPA